MRPGGEQRFDTSSWAGSGACGGEGDPRSQNGLSRTIPPVGGFGAVFGVGAFSWPFAAGGSCVFAATGVSTFDVVGSVLGGVVVAIVVAVAVLAAVPAAVAVSAGVVSSLGGGGGMSLIVDGGATPSCVGA